MEDALSHFRAHPWRTAAEFLALPAAVLVILAWGPVLEALTMR